SAPRSESSSVQYPPGSSRVRSSTVTPARGRERSELGSEPGTIAATGYGGREVWFSPTMGTTRRRPGNAGASGRWGRLARMPESMAERDIDGGMLPRGVRPPGHWQEAEA